MPSPLELVPRPAYPIGVDLSASGAKLLQLRRARGGLRLVGMSRVEIEADGAPVDDSARIDELVRAVAERAQAGGFAGSRCVVSLDERLLRVRSVRLPRMSDAETDAAVRLDAPQRLGFAEGEACEIGWLRAGEVVHGDEARDEIIYLGAPRAALEHLAMGLSSCGLRPVAIEPGFVAAARRLGWRLRRAADTSVVRVLVDVGRRTSEVMITRGRFVAFYKTLEFGGEAMTLAAAERLGLEPASVEDLRRRRMRPDGGRDVAVDEKVDRALFDAVRPLMGELAHEVNLCVRHYSVTFRGSRAGACVLVGGEALEPRLVEAVGEATHLETSVGRPLEGVAGVEPGDWPEWAVAAGLSLQPTETAPVRRRGGGRRAMAHAAREAEGARAA